MKVFGTVVGVLIGHCGQLVCQECEIEGSL
jgi:hypothetical protein